MNRQLSIGIFFLSVCLGVPNVWACDRNTWLNFLNEPTKSTHNEFMKVYQRNKNTLPIKCVLRPVPAETTKLLKLIDKKNRYAMDVAFISIHGTDGGELEDMYRAIGTIVDYDAKYFLELVKKHHVVDYSIDRMLTMLPLYTVDDFDAKINLVQSRLHKVDRVNNKTLKEEKAVSKEALNDYLLRLKKIKASTQ